MKNQKSEIRNPKIAPRHLSDNNNGAFTLIEMLIVIVIISIIIGFSFTNLLGKREATDLSSSASQIAALLREAQIRAANQDSGKNWGVYFGNPTSSTPFYSLYSSSSSAPYYTATSSRVVESYRLPTTLAYSLPPAASSTDVNFSQITGQANQAATIKIYILNATTSSSTITVATTGAINY